MQKIREGELPVLAIDVGGTKILTALVADDGHIRASEYCSTLADGGPEAVIDRICSSIGQLLDRESISLSQLHSISIGVAGPIDSSKGLITVSPNLPGWHDVPLRGIVKEKYRVDTYLVNDASAAALGEHRVGAGRGTENLVYITVSTGIGGGIIINGELYLGTSGSAGEIGHMVIDVNGPRCHCGNTGCLEVLASGTAVAREAIRRIGQGEKSSITEIVGGKLENITAEKVSLAAQKGDSLALEITSQAATYLGLGLVNVVNIFNPEMIVIGGGVSKMGDLLLNPARQVVRERAFQLAAQAVSVVPAGLGDNAGVLGAAIFARQQK